ncbi:hypothetical protein QZH41_015293, partial [Actinostola sp. cb2023]
MDLKWRRVPFNGISTDLEQLPQDTASREFSKILKGLVLNDRTGEALLVQDKKKYTIGTTRKSFWKFPGGLSEEGENIGTTAEREIFEETGVKSEFQSVLLFRQHHEMKSTFNKSDIYV